MEQSFNKYYNTDNNNEDYHQNYHRIKNYYDETIDDDDNGDLQFTTNVPEYFANDSEKENLNVEDEDNWTKKWSYKRNVQVPNESTTANETITSFVSCNTTNGFRSIIALQ